MSVSNLAKVYARSYQFVMKLVMGTDILNWDEPELLEGPGAVKKLPALIKSKGYDNVLVVTDKGLTSLHLLDGLYEALEKEGIKYTVFDEVQPNPTIRNVEACKNAYVSNNCQAMISFGGGSPMDTAKAAGAVVANPNKKIKQMIGVLKVTKKIPPIFAVPTTAGTGSEVTVAAVITDEETHEKGAVNDPKLRPGVAVLDPELTIGLPPKITSTTGMDALTHAVEAFIGRSNVANTEDAAKKAVKLIFDNLKIAYDDGSNLEARANMLKASYYAGIAFTRAYVGYVHAIGHNLGGFYNVPHGLAMSVILPYVLDYYGETAYERLAMLADAAGLETSGLTTSKKAKLFIAKVRELNASMGIPEHIEGILEKDIPTIAQRALREGNPLYPVPKLMDFDDCCLLIKKIGGLK
ncbi:MAG: iron-containing alcohol dehydrogenase [Clostridia bacterium]|nr:iron-containing alcohol dehydrogenase [Clostridia bacterium]